VHAFASLEIYCQFWLTITEYLNICITNDHGYMDMFHLLVVSTFRSFLHSWLITGFVTRVTRCH